MKIKNVKMIDVSDWDDLVIQTYGRPYNFQQQDGCKQRGTFGLTIPSEETYDEMYEDSIPDEINGKIMGIKFEKWLERDPKLNVFDRDFSNNLFWERNFYPDVYTLANDLHSKGLIEAGDYVINIDW